jgi:hypothetical protein
MPNAPTTTASPAAPAQQPAASASTVATPLPGYETMTFEQRRLAQDQNAAAARRITLARSRT